MSADRPLSILHLHSYHLYTGAAEPLLNLIRAERARGHDSRLAVETVRPGDVIERAQALGVPIDPRFALSVKASPLLHLRDVLALKRVYREGEVDIVHAHGSHDHTLAALARLRGSKTRLVRTLHTERAAGRFRSWQLRRSDGLLAVALRFRTDLLRRGLLSEERIAAIEGAVDSAIYHPAPGQKVRDEFGVSSAVPVAGIVARMKPGRGHRWLLDSWERAVLRLPGARLFLAGRGELDKALRERVQRSSLAGSVVFLGYRRDLPEVYRSLDLKILLSPGNDGTCRAGLEAMACGVPVLAAKKGALCEIVRPGQTGELVAWGDRQALADALVRLLADRDRLRELGRAAREETVTRFTLDRQVTAVLHLYRQVLSGQGERLI